MFRTVANNVWAFDLEWVPDAASGRRAYNLPAGTPDEEVYRVMWERGGATDENPRPYLKTMLCRVVSVAAVLRQVYEDGRVALILHSLPDKSWNGPMSEDELIGRFLHGLEGSRERPQLVGFNSREADLPILIQRGIVNGITAAGLCRRPEKSWEGYDYFNKYNEAHIDLKEVVGGWGKATPSLHELAAACGIPGKMGTAGDNVIDLWLAGDIRAIVDYNEFDALTTYLVWLRTAHFAGFFSDDQYVAEQTLLRDLIRRQIDGGRAHLARYLERWDELSALV